jgi:hypothetical protein
MVRNFSRDPRMQQEVLSPSHFWAGLLSFHAVVFPAVSIITVLLEFGKKLENKPF